MVETWKEIRMAFGMEAALHKAEPMYRKAVGDNGILRYS